MSIEEDAHHCQVEKGVIYPYISGTGNTEDENRIVNNLQELLGLEQKIPLNASLHWTIIYQSSTYYFGASVPRP